MKTTPHLLDLQELFVGKPQSLAPFFNLEQRLKAGDALGASNMFTASRRAEYRAFFSSLGANLATIANQLGTLVGGTFTVGQAELVIVRTTVNGQAAFPINLIRDPDGIWRIESM